VRAIASVLDLSWVYGELSPHYPAVGRPSIDPVLMIRMLILGYAFGLRSPILEKPVRTADGARLRENAAPICQRRGESHTRFGEWPPAKNGALSADRHPHDLRHDSGKPVGAPLPVWLSDGTQRGKRILRAGRWQG
jgi:hypothetical protein